MKPFSQRKGFKPVSETIQLDYMNESLRNSLWNALDVSIWSSQDFMYRQYGNPHIEGFSKALWFHYFKKPIDSRPEQSSKILKTIRDYFFSCEWYEMYDFLEFVVRDRERAAPKLPAILNLILESELAGYRFASGHVVDVTSSEELAMVEEAARDTRFAGVSAHIERALELYSNRNTSSVRSTP